MTGLYQVEVEPKVRSWLEGLPDRDFGRVDFVVGRSPNTPKRSASPTPVTSTARSANCDSTYSGNRPA